MGEERERYVASVTGQRWERREVCRQCDKTTVGEERGT